MKIVIGGVVTVVAALIIAATGWNFKATAEMPENYVNKNEQRIFIERNDKEHGKIQETLDNILEHIIDINKRVK